MFLLVILADTAYCLSYYIADDKDAYYLPTFLSLALAAAFGIRWAMMFAKVKPVMIVVAAALPVIALASNYQYSDRSEYFYAHDYIENALKSVEPGGMILTADWQLYAPSFYVCDIEGNRRDAVIIDTNLLRRSWYFGYLEQVYPDVIERSRNEVNDMVADLLDFERDPASFQKSPSRTQRANAHLNQLIRSLILNQMERGPLYVSFDLADPDGKDDVHVSKVVGDDYELVPQGLLFRVHKKASTDFLAQPEINTRGLNDIAKKYDQDDIVRASVARVYVNMLSNSGIYLGSKGRKDEAARQFRKALAIDPEFEPAKKGLDFYR